MSRNRRWGLAAATAVLIGGAIACTAAEIVSGDPLVQRIDAALLAPGTPNHLLGTDHLGRDVLSRLLHGGQSSYIVALGSALVAGTIGTVLGLASGIAHRTWVDRTLRIVTDGVLAFPTVLLAITVGLVLGPGRNQVTWTLGIVFSPVVYRVVRMETRRTVLRDYYLVSRMLGSAVSVRAVFHLLPSVLPQVLIQLASLAALAVGTEAALSFLGLGTQPPEASWGLMLNDARRYLVQAPYLSLFPGIAAGLLAFSLQYISDSCAVRFA